VHLGDTRGATTGLEPGGQRQVLVGQRAEAGRTGLSVGQVRGLVMEEGES